MCGNLDNCVENSERNMDLSPQIPQNDTKNYEKSVTPDFYMWQFVAPNSWTDNNRTLSWTRNPEFLYEMPETQRLKRLSINLFKQNWTIFSVNPENLYTDKNYNGAMCHLCENT